MWWETVDILKQLPKRYSFYYCIREEVSQVFKVCSPLFYRGFPLPQPQEESEPRLHRLLRFTLLQPFLWCLRGLLELLPVVRGSKLVQLSSLMGPACAGIDSGPGPGLESAGTPHGS